MSESPTCHLFVYYRAAPDRWAALLPKLRDVQSDIARHFGVRVRLMRKADDNTWMEIYEGVPDPDALLTRLDARLAEIDFEACLMPDSCRHLERFECV